MSQPVQLSSNSETASILIVDDVPPQLRLLYRYLELNGFDVKMARDGESGLETAQQTRPDLILLDILMPGMDGFETCRRLKANDNTRNIPVIFLTALPGTEDKVRGFDLGGVDYITKPLQYDEVLARVNTHLHLNRLNQRLIEKNICLQGMVNKLQPQNGAPSNDAVPSTSQIKTSEVTAASLEPGKLLGETINSIQSQLDFNFVGIWTLDKSQTSLTLKTNTPTDTPEFVDLNSCLPLNSSTSVVARVFNTQHPYINNNIKKDYPYLHLDTLPPTRSQLVVPLQIEQKIVGVLDIQSTHSNAFTPSTRAVLQTQVSQITIAVHNILLYENERRLRQQESARVQNLAALNTAKDKFLSIIAHDLRGPFLPLLGWSEMLYATADESDSDIKAISQKIRRSAKSVSALLEDLLQWSRMQLGRMEYNPQTIHLKPLVDTGFDLVTEYAASKNITLHHTITDNNQIFADKNMINTVIRNLILNAIKFTPTGGLVSISAKATATSPDFVEVSVTDTGVGISQEDMKTLFKIDERPIKEGTAQETGTGLGLIICKEMIQKNHGQIVAKSQVGQGTTITFTVPVVAVFNTSGRISDFDNTSHVEN